jgi:translation initiation factor 1 (eIF-1/SUI1)
VISSLSKAYGALDQRAEIRTEDEFGVLVRDLDIFLDRINRLISELNQILQRVVTVNHDIVTIQGDLRGQIDRVLTGVRRLERDAMLALRANRAFQTIGSRQSEPRFRRLMHDLRRQATCLMLTSC